MLEWPGETLELVWVFLVVFASLGLMVAFGRWWEN